MYNSIKSLLCISVLFTTLFAIAQNQTSWSVESVISQMDEGSSILCGHTPETGVWVVCQIEMDANPSVKKDQQISLAEIRARREISEWMNVTIESQATHSMSQTTTAAGVVQHEMYQELTKTKTEAFLRGVTLHSIQNRENAQYAYFYTTGRLVNRSAELEAQLKQAPPGVVRAVGFGVIAEGKISPAKRQAMQQALRNAVEQVMGTTVIGQSQLMDNEKAKSKLISQTMGAVKQYRILKEEHNGINYQVILNAQIDEKNLLDNYASMVRSMGNPGFAIQCNDPDLKVSLTDFFASMGFKVTEDPAAIQFVVEASCEYLPINDEYYGEGIQIDVHLRLYDVKTRQQILSMRNDPRKTSTYTGTLHRIRQKAAGTAFRTMKKELHEKLNKIVMDWVLNGREVIVIFNNVPSSMDEALVSSVKDVPCVEYHTKKRDGNKLILNCSYVGSSSDFEDFLLERFKKDLPANFRKPVTNKVELNMLEFTF